MLSVGAGLILARRIARPLGRLTDVAETMSTTGRLEMDAPPPARGSDETRRLARAFAAMVESLRQSRDAQSRLVQDAGHELRTALTRSSDQRVVAETTRTA